ncbi:hypothetical protein [Terriglobus sp. RCC_193]|uniref:hypothetical protein n=1 Tax=Terriglobus sp. RCC_193 TaxID=3239218 RepID=UPI003525E8A5
MGIIDRSMKDAAVEAISDDLRFYTTFNAILALANTELRASGYRTTHQQGHHTRTLETLEYTLSANPKLIRKLLAFQRNATLPVMTLRAFISRQELEDILETASELRYSVESWLRERHPNLIARN